MWKKAITEIWHWGSKVAPVKNMRAKVSVTTMVESPVLMTLRGFYGMGYIEYSQYSEV